MFCILCWQSQRATSCSHLLTGSTSPTWVSKWEAYCHYGLTPGRTGGEATPPEELGERSEQAGTCPCELTSQPQGPSSHPWRQLKSGKTDLLPWLPTKGSLVGRRASALTASPRRGPPKHPLLAALPLPADAHRWVSSSSDWSPAQILSGLCPAPSLPPPPTMKGRTNPTHCALQEGSVHSSSAHHCVRWCAGEMFNHRLAGGGEALIYSI